MERLNQSLQQNLLALLCYSKKDAPVLINSLNISLFESSIYREIFGIATTYFQQFKEPIAEHLKDELDSKINPVKKDIRAIESAKLYRLVLSEIKAIHKSVNNDYVMNQLSDFIEVQEMKNDVLKTHKLLSKEKISKDDIEKAKLILYTNKKNHLMNFDQGVLFSDSKQVLSSLDMSEDLLPVGIPELDNFGACPSKKTLTLFASLPGKGKSWFMGMAAAYNAFNRRNKVLHISLEMYWKQVIRRYLQTVFGVSEDTIDLKVPEIEIDIGNNSFKDFKFETITPNFSFKQEGIGKALREELKKIKSGNRLIVKDFPSGTLTIDMLRVYIDSLINYSNFHPDLVVLDYADIMKVDAKNKRIDLGTLLVELRGLAGEYNFGLLTGAQFNRGAKLEEKKKWYDEAFFQEDFSKANTADKIISFNQTDSEYAKNFARLLVVKNRGRRSGQKIIITQSYDTGQFCRDSIMLLQSESVSENYWVKVGGKRAKKKNE